jgi:hypothetical protein
VAERAWPFENKPEGALAEPYRKPQDFIAARGEGTEAVVVRIGLHDAQLVLVDAEGAWERWVYRSVDEAKAVAEGLGVDVHVDEFPEDTRVRMNAYRRPAADFDRAAYPEQGFVGAVSAYPENRPRRIEAPKEESPGS